MIGTLYSARLRGKRQTRGAARLLLGELADARRTIALALDENSWDALSSNPPRLRSWDRVSQTIAQMRGATWRKVNAAAEAVELVADVSESRVDSRIHPDTDPDAPGDADRTELLEAKHAIEEAILALARAGRFKDEAEEVALDRELAEKYP